MKTILKKSSFPPDPKLARSTVTSQLAATSKPTNIPAMVLRNTQFEERERVQIPKIRRRIMPKRYSKSYLTIVKKFQALF